MLVIYSVCITLFFLRALFQTKKKQPNKETKSIQSTKQYLKNPMYSSYAGIKSKTENLKYIMK